MYKKYNPGHPLLTRTRPPAVQALYQTFKNVSKLSIVVTSALITLAAAIPNTTPPVTPPTSQQCCSSVQSSNSNAITPGLTDRSYGRNAFGVGTLPDTSAVFYPDSRTVDHKFLTLLQAGCRDKGRQFSVESYHEMRVASSQTLPAHGVQEEPMEVQCEEPNEIETM
ncbi:hypothetical protein FB451DRAFT_1387540 [Mycena latifolia]|nr:hypothetical protein FB451DRAFT_1387540 [Mycena latifolia]